MDGCHVYIRAPVDDHTAYINRKNWYSILFQATVDLTGKFVEVSVWNVGRDHDAHVFQCSNIFDAMDAKVWVPGNPTLTLQGFTIPTLIVANAAYPLHTRLKTPHGGRLNPEKIHYNRVHNEARSVVGWAFGWLKTQWPGHTVCNGGECQCCYMFVCHSPQHMREFCLSTEHWSVWCSSCTIAQTTWSTPGSGWQATGCWKSA